MNSLVFFGWLVLLDLVLFVGSPTRFGLLVRFVGSVGFVGLVWFGSVRWFGLFIGSVWFLCSV